MSPKDRAKQFAPFDALKGLGDALRIKEYENERVQKGEVSEEKAASISRTLLMLKKGDNAQVLYFYNGHYLTICGKVKLQIEKNLIEIDNKKIDLNDLFDIKVVNKNEWKFHSFFFINDANLIKNS